MGKAPKCITEIYIMIIVILLSSYTLFKVISYKSDKLVMGGLVHVETKEKNVDVKTSTEGGINDSERFQRPSKENLLNLKYNFVPPKNLDVKPPYILDGYPAIYQTSEDVVQAFFSIIKVASNMEGYQGGCGTINWHSYPYPYAYELLSDSTKKGVSLQKFKDSFKGVGQVNLLKLIPAYKPVNTPDNIQYYFVETEIVTGPEVDEGIGEKRKGSYFAYYYGLITTEFDKKSGWKIKAFDYVPEDFLCIPFHGWSWDSGYLVEGIYHDWYGLIDKVDKVDKKGYIIDVYASGKGKDYKFQFVRITNGEDLMLNEYIKENGEWKETNILKDNHQQFKFSILNPEIK